MAERGELMGKSRMLLEDRRKSWKSMENMRESKEDHGKYKEINEHRQISHTKCRNPEDVEKSAPGKDVYATARACSLARSLALDSHVRGAPVSRLARSSLAVARDLQPVAASEKVISVFEAWLFEFVYGSARLVGLEDEASWYRTWYAFEFARKSRVQI